MTTTRGFNIVDGAGGFLAWYAEVEDALAASRENLHAKSVVRCRDGELIARVHTVRPQRFTGDA